MFRLSTMVVAAIIGLSVSFVSFRIADAYYGSSYTYYLTDAHQVDYADITASGQWGSWPGNVLQNVFPRIDVNIYSQTADFHCWRLEIASTTLGMERSGSTFKNGDTVLNYGNTPWDHYEIQSAIGAPADLTWMAGLGYNNSICNPAFAVGELAYNTFVVPFHTNYNNQGPRRRPIVW